MKPGTFFLTGLAAAALCPAAAVLAQPDPAPERNLSVLVSGLKPATGTVEVSLFDSAESFLREPYRQESGAVNPDGQFGTEFVFLAEGEYAIVVVHDANGNGRLDTGFLGFGGERYGYSNNVSAWFGRPDFDEVKFRVEGDGTLVEIDLD